MEVVPAADLDRLVAAARTIFEGAVRHNGKWARVTFDDLDALIGAAGFDVEAAYREELPDQPGVE